MIIPTAAGLFEKKKVSLSLCYTHITILSDDAEKFSINEAVVEFDNAGMIKAGQQAGFSHGIHRFIWL